MNNKNRGIRFSGTYSELNCKRFKVFKEKTGKNISDIIELVGMHLPGLYSENKIYEQTILERDLYHYKKALNDSKKYVKNMENKVFKTEARLKAISNDFDDFKNKLTDKEEEAIKHVIKILSYKLKIKLEHNISLYDSELRNFAKEQCIRWNSNLNQVNFIVENILNGSIDIDDVLTSSFENIELEDSNLEEILTKKV